MNSEARRLAEIVRPIVAHSPTAFTALAELEEIASAALNALNPDHGEAVVPASASDCSCPSVEALEAERDKWKAEANRQFEIAYEVRLDRREIEAGRDQTIKERDEAREALRAYSSAYPCPGFEIEPGLTSGCSGSSDDCPTCAALAGVPGGGQGREDE